MNAMLKPVVLRPQIGLLGVGASARSRLQALIADDTVDIAAIADARSSAREWAAAVAPRAILADGMHELLDAAPPLDGIVIATPTNTHHAHALAALDRGVSVFCRMPMTRTAAEATQVVGAARRNDCLLLADTCFRFAPGAAGLRDLIRAGDLGTLYAIDLKFHSAFAPEQPWIYNVAKSGGGCVMDLGSPMLDFAAWATDCGQFEAVEAQLFAHGRRIERRHDAIEDYATVQCRLATGASLRLTCSWHLPAGSEAVIEAAFYGTRGGAVMRNVGGSLHDLHVDHLQGTRARRIAAPVTNWRQRPLRDWAARLGDGARFDAGARYIIDVATIVDRIYGS